MAKRRFVSLLPEHNQTETLKKFFGSTVDHVFQPGRAESLTGYIGQKEGLRYYDPNKDFYVYEPTASRRAYQLEPAMVSRTDAGEISHLLFYDDLVNYLRSSNANVSDHNRLFSDEYYSWAPPVDIDKLQNFQQYFWFGESPESIPTLVLIAEARQYMADGTTATFELPPRVDGVDVSRETVTVYINGDVVECEATETHAILTKTPYPGSDVVVYRYGDLTKVIEGLASFNPSPFTNGQGGVTSLSSGMRLQLKDGPARFAGYDVLSYEAVIMRDGKDTLVPWDEDSELRYFWVEGVGSSIDLVPFSNPADFAKKPMHVTIDRRSQDQNPWSRNNFWMHRNAFSWAGGMAAFAPFQATRPIIEFIPNIELYKYGFRRLPDINATLSGPPIWIKQPVDRAASSELTDWNIDEFDTLPYESSALHPISLQDANGKPMGTVFVDAGHVLRFGDRVLVLESDDPNLKNRIITVRASGDDGEMVMFIEVSPAPRLGDIVRMPVRGLIGFDLTKGYDEEPWEYSSDPIEYYFNGTAWEEAQRVNYEDTDPLFALYTEEQVAYDSFPNSTFAGNRIFGYAKGDGALDSVLARPLKYSKSGDIVFENDIVTRRATSNGAPIKGSPYFRITSDDQTSDQYLSGWYATTGKTTQTVSNGIHSVPLNLTANPDNEEVTFIWQGAWLDHFTSILSRQEGFSGSAYARNNWRNTKRDLSLGQHILQHRSPLLKLMLLASDKRFDYFDAVRFVEIEYIRFRNKFVQQTMEVLRTGQRLVEDAPDLWVETILRNLRVAKTNEFPFALSDVAGGQYFIPPTPQTLGVLPPVEPGLEIDDTYSTPLTFIRGHDGSRTPAFGDIRDTILLALERRIYNNIKIKFKGEHKPLFDFFDYVDGRNRSAVAGNGRYSRAEIIRLYTPLFMRWAQTNNVDYRSNTGFVLEDPFTWNYRDVPDRDGKPMPGHWRAIYRYYFDTDRPHLSPWEMVGFASKPEWWDAEYGVAPYTRGNTKLWNDMRDGRIARGPRKGIDARFARPDLYDYLPINDDGGLLNPIEALIIPVQPTLQQAKRQWMVGDHGPLENLWLSSVSFTFAKAAMAALMRPAQWLEMGWDSGNVTKVNNQWVNLLTHNRPRSKEIYVHGETLEDGTRVAVTGIQQWIIDLMVSRGQDPAILGNAVRGLAVHLSHKMAGFTRQDNLRVFADNFGIVPEEDVEVLYHQSPPIREASYSGLIIEWTGEGWRIIGYDTTKEEFIIIPGEKDGPQTTISLGADPLVYEWNPRVFYKAGQLVDYKGSTYRCVQDHTSGVKFESEEEFWSPAPGLGGSRFPKVQVSNEGTGVPTKIPYNTTYTTTQQVADFIRDYSRWLEEEGWVFDGIDPDTGEVQDWNAAIREFLKWAQMNWEPGNFIALSPGASQIKFVTQHGTVYNIEETANGIYGLIDRTGKPIPRRNTFVTRLDEETKIITITDDLFGARLRIGEIEHVLVFSNTTIFNDIIYQPLYNLRQPRLRLIGMRTGDWKGRRDAPGYMIEGNNLLPNFEKAADNIRNMFEIERSEDRDMRDQARHVIGYQNRPYLDNLLLSETQQFEFYQGMIQQKGAPGVFDKLSRSQFVDVNRDLRFLEEWAFHVGRYGAVEKSKRVAFKVNRSDIRANPQFIRFNEDNPYDAIIGILPNDSRWIEKPTDVKNLFPYKAENADRTDFLPTAGYVRTNEVDLAAFRPSLLNTLYDAAKSLPTYMRLDTRIWLYDNDHGTWDVMQAYPIGPDNILVDRFETPTEDETLDFYRTRVVFNQKHNLTNSDVGSRILFAGRTLTDPDMEGFVLLAEIEDEYTVLVEAAGLAGYEFEEAMNTLPVFIFRSVRFTTLADFQTFCGRFAPRPNQIVYIDDMGNGTWGVQKWSGSAWETIRQQPKKIDTHRINSALVYDRKTRLTKTTMDVEPLMLDGITVLDPVAGLIPGIAEREITYKVEYDPARYIGGANDQWGKAEVGRLWWDLSTVRFLEVETDILDTDDADRTNAEINYRVANWGKVAPGSSIDIYEWTRSLTHPEEYGDAIKTPDTPSWIEVDEFDEKAGKPIRVYYFWLRNVQTVPNLEGRKMSARQVASVLSNPKANDLPWIAPVIPDGLLVGGIEQFLTDDTSVLQFELTKDDYEGVIHNEWQLVRAQDDRTLPPGELWKALRNSLVGFDELEQPVPDPALPEDTRVGFSLRPRQTLFANGRDGMLAARRSFVDMINHIFGRTNLLASRPEIISQLTSETPTYQMLIWSRSDNDDSILPPPVNSYDYTVSSLAERDLLYYLPEFQANPGRILVTNYEAEHPSWSIWENDPLVTDVSLPNYRLKLSSHYDVEIPSRAELLTLIQAGDIEAGKRLLIKNDEQADGFWTLWLYDPSSVIADRNGLVFKSAQTYRTSDFVEVIDWYADGYMPKDAPVVRYPTIESRNIAEMPIPQNTFVRVDNDGTGNWAWYRYENADGSGRNGVWTIVARQNGSIRLSDKLYDSSRVLYSTDRSWLDNIANRDGAWELRIIIDSLRNNILSNQEVNELFFSMLHFVHAQQDQVPWAFKTSFLSVVGFNEMLDQRLVQMYDNTENLLAYIDEVKPYRVKTRDFSRMLTPEIEQANVHATDFDKPLYFDPAINAYRRLDLANPNDLEIVKTKQPWKDWYDNYLNGSLDPASPNFNPVRKLNLTMRFDRIDPEGEAPLDPGFGWDYVGFDLIGYDTEESMAQAGSSALARLLRYYEPQLGMREKTASALLGIDFKGIEIDGGELYVPKHPDLTAWDIKAFDTFPSEMKITTERDFDITGAALDEELQIENGPLVNPYHSARHPEELLMTDTNDVISMVVHTDWKIGAPGQYTTTVTTQRVRGSTMTISYEEIAQSADGVWVYRDGVKAVEGADFYIDHFGRKLLINLGTPRASKIMVHVFTTAATSKVLKQIFYPSDSGMVVDMGFVPDPENEIEVLVDGKRLYPNQWSMLDQYLTLAQQPQVNQDILINVYETPGTATTVNRQPLYYINGVHSFDNQSWEIESRTLATTPEYIGTIVEVDGLRLTPPFTRYGAFSLMNRAIQVREVQDINNLEVWVGGDDTAVVAALVPNPDEYPLVGTMNIDSPNAKVWSDWGTLPFDNQPLETRPDWVMLNDILFLNNIEIIGIESSIEATVVIREGHDYDVYDGNAIIYKQLGYGPYDTWAGGWDSVTVPGADGSYDMGYSVDPNIRIEATTFSNADLMEIEVHSFKGSQLGTYFFPSSVPSLDYLTVTVNGKRLSDSLDFDTSVHEIAYDELGWDTWPFDMSAEYNVLTIPGGQSPQHDVVVMAYRGEPARKPETWAALSARTSTSMIGNAAVGGDWDNAPFDTVPVGTTVPRVADTEYGLRSLYRMNGSWELFHWNDERAVALEHPLLISDEQIVVRVNPFKSSQNIIPEYPLPEPNTDTGQPGVIWINGERIEYFAMSRTGDLITLTEIRRGTRGTHAGTEQRSVAVFSGDGTTTSFYLPGAYETRRVEVSLYDAVGRVTYLTLGEDHHYTLTQEPMGVTVTLATAPMVGESLAIAQTKSLSHPAGTIVRHATPDSYDSGPFHRLDDIQIVAESQ